MFFFLITPQEMRSNRFTWG